MPETKQLKKVNRSQFVTYLDVTPTDVTKNWALLGVGITEYGITYNPQVEQEKWIIEDNARTDHTSNQKQSSVSQKMYMGDACFEFARNGLDKLNYVTNILDIDRYVSNEDGSYPAKMSQGKLVITQYMSDDAVIEYDLYYEGDPQVGTVTFADGVPTFTPTTE